jgi:hypothetical protein
MAESYEINKSHSKTQYDADVQAESEHQQKVGFKMLEKPRIPEYYTLLTPYTKHSNLWQGSAVKTI